MLGIAWDSLWEGWDTLKMIGTAWESLWDYLGHLENAWNALGQLVGMPGTP